MRRLVLLSLAAALGGCSSVKIVQRDGCWVRETKKPFSSSEELGPCGRPEPKWSDDRITRVTQECVAQADYRWQSRALEAWNRGQPLPERPSDDTVLQDCMEQVSRSQLAENERLRQRLDELDAEKTQISARAEKDRSDLLAGYEKMAADLGQAARKPAPPAIATATAKSEGRTTSEGRSSSEAEKEPRAVAAMPVLPLPAPVSAPPPAAKSKKPGTKTVATPPAGCPPTTETADDATPEKIQKTSGVSGSTPGP